MTEKGLLVILSGFSGAGKGTLVRELLRRYPEEYALSVSATTRRPRAGETDGKDYFFVTKERFEELISSDGLIEYACYVGNYYGTPREYVERQRELGKDVLLEIEIQGARKVKEAFPEAVLIFIAPPDAETLASRLSGRGTETPEQIEGRLRRAAEESRRGRPRLRPIHPGGSGRKTGTADSTIKEKKVSKFFDDTTPRYCR